MIPIQLLGLSNNRNILLQTPRQPSPQQRRQPPPRPAPIGGAGGLRPTTDDDDDERLLRRRSTSGCGTNSTPTHCRRNTTELLSPLGVSTMTSGSQPGGFGGISDRFTQGVSFLKRRFSSNDLSDENAAETRPPGTQPTTMPTAAVANNAAHHAQQQPQTNPFLPQQQPTPPHARPTPPPQAVGGPPPAGYAAAQQQRPPSSAAEPPPTGFSLTGLTNKISSTISAPTSPSKHREPPHSQASMYTQVQGITRNLFQAATGTTQKQPVYNREKCKCLLVVDDQHTDWSKYFRGKKILNDFELRVEQANFTEVSLSAYSDSGCVVETNSYRTGTHQTRSFQPDFVVIRQPVRTEKTDSRKVVIGLLFGAVPSLNSLHSIYNFYDKPWVFAHLLMIQRRLGKEKFPLIDQAYYPAAVTEQWSSPRFPLIAKIGSGHKGVGKVKVEDENLYQDVQSVATLADQSFTTEPFVHAKYDIRIQKIGNSYKAFMRKGISGHWKANIGSSMLEQIAMTDRYKLWVDEVAQLFGGLDICCVEAIVGQDGRELIYGANDCSFTLLGETQEEDRRLIAELALSKMNHILGVRHAITQSRKESVQNAQAAPQNYIKHESPAFHGAQAANRPPPSSSSAPQPAPPQSTPPSATANRSAIPQSVVNPAAPSPMPAPSSGRPQQAAPPPPTGARPATSGKVPPPRPARQPSLTSDQPPQATPPPQQQEQEDTMGSLKKTFAGIFGDM